MTFTPPDDFFMGESPPLPPSLIVELRAWFAEKLWDTAANTAVQFFEGWRRG